MVGTTIAVLRTGWVTTVLVLGLVATNYVHVEPAIVSILMTLTALSLLFTAADLLLGWTRKTSNDER